MTTSLVERKKRQWALEKDELEKLWAPWGRIDLQNYSPQSARDQFSTKISIENHCDYSRDSFSDNSLRKNSLPPVNKYSTERNEKGGETSGYASDNPNCNADYPQQNWNNQNQQSGYESSSSREDRPKWRDKEANSDLFWDRKNNNDNLNGNEPPNWLKRGLEQDGHIEVTNSSPSESPEQGYNEQDRPYTSSSSVRSRTYIRGQNIQLDIVEIAERERKREIARQHQDAVRKQLEERERKRSEERKRRIQEEYEEELRIAREQEIERKRQEHEQKLLQEKQQKEEKRKEAIKEAIELAEKEAKLQKMKLKLMKQNKNTNLNNECSKNNSNDINKNKNGINTNNNLHKEKSNLTPRDIDVSKKLNNHKDSEEHEISKNEKQNNNICIKNNLDLPSSSKDNSQQENQQKKNEPLAIVVPSNLENLQQFQYAVLMPIPSSSSIPVAIPISIPTEKQQITSTTTRTENRILTPTQYRQKNKFMCDSSTQTDDIRIEKYNRDKNINLDSNYETRSRKGRSSSRSENLTDRPKWGVNRPPTRYMKQSEKDPLYQRKKLRQRNQDNLYDDKNSSDESQTGTPRYTKKEYLDKRHKRSLWRKHDRDEVFSRPIRMYQSEIIPIETDKNNVCYEHRCCCTCKCTGGVQLSETLKIEDELVKDEDKLPKMLNENLIEDKHLMVESLPSLRNNMLKQEQWNSPRTPSLT